MALFITIPIIKNVDDGETGFIPMRVPGNGKLTQVMARFYPGQAKTLKVRVMLERKGQVPVDVFPYPAGGDNYLSGDDDTFDVARTLEIINDDHFKIWYSNENGAGHIYTVAVFLTFDLEGIGGR